MLMMCTVHSVYPEFIGAEGTGLLLDTMPMVPQTEALGQGREEGLARTLYFALDWVVVHGTVGFPLREVEERSRGERT